MTDSRGLYLGIDGLDFMRKGDPNPCMKLRGCYYDKNRPKEQRMTQSVDCYLPIGRFLVFAHDMLGGQFVKRKAAQMKSGKKDPYFTQYGGRADGNTVVARRLARVDGLGENLFAFTLSEGEGRQTLTGAILPKEGVKPRTSLFFNMPSDELKEMCLLGQAYINQYIAIDLQNRLTAVRAMRANYTAGAGGPWEERNGG